MHSRRSDIANERLPEFSEPRPMFPAPSTRSSRLGHDGVDMEDLIKRTLEEEDDDGGVVEKLAEKIARGRSATGRPGALKRFDTT